MKLYFFYAFIISQVLACAGEFQVLSEQKSVYTIVLSDIQENKRYHYKSGVTARSPGLCEISWINQDNMETTYCLDPNKTNDTIRIELLPSSRNLEVAHKIQGLDYFFYSINANDTLRLHYNHNGFPEVKSPSVKSKVDNFFLASYQKYYDSLIDPEIFLRSDYSRQIFEKWEQIRGQKNLKRLRIDYVNLDSVFRVTEDAYISKLSELKELDLADSETLLDQVTKMRMFSKLSISNFESHKVEERRAYMNRSFDPHRVSDRIYFRAIYDAFLKSDTILNEEHLEQVPKHLVKFFHQLDLERIANLQSLGKVENAIDNYLRTFNDSEDSTFIESIKIAVGISTTKSDLLLKDIDGEITTLSNVVSTSKKLWYIDFWASWCAPCLREFPYSKSLQTEFENDSIGFIYLAFNDKERMWKQQCIEQELAQIKENYLIINSKSADFVNQLKINSLPRYIIMDGNYKILVSSANRPSDKTLRPFLKKLLHEK